ncbi:DsbA family protein [Variovorax sp. PAMC 28711]|uniref:DsbA family protein n=1 Tax=Variovorax sp. PAMC 28711 TaxID=1795631 RepID=UPI00078EBDB4|nr:DsbA family protein [Variovorax sp. PAMC 28711]AMM26917.1 disulfide bond formation protein DsbA [Variovorax sp. PAMC 28711]
MTSSSIPPHLLLAPDSATDHIHGTAKAKVTLVEYGDFECPSCGQAHAALKIVLAHFGPQVRFVFRHFPLREVHPRAELAAEASEAAGAQGKFWPYHDKLFDNQQHLDEKHLKQYAQDLGLDMARYENEMRDHVYLQRVQEQMQGATALHVRATPSFYVNGVFCDVSFGLEHLHQAIDKALLEG